MRCPQCGFDNPGGTKFCGQCGTKLGTACRSCGTVNPEGFAFCGTCGASLTSVAAPTATAEERKVVTILFADITGSTTIAERLDPEQMRTMMGRFFQAMTEVIGRYEGTVEKYIGDEVMAVFGLPVAHEDDPERAVRAAAAMRERLDELNGELEATRGIALQMRIGITGAEAVPDPQATEKGEFMVTGDAVNVAARLRGAAEPGGTVVGERTYWNTVPLVEYRPLSPLALKGKSLPVQAWEFVRLLPEAARRGAGGLRAPLIGRGGEDAALPGDPSSTAALRHGPAGPLAPLRQHRAVVRGGDHPGRLRHPAQRPSAGDDGEGAAASRRPLGGRARDRRGRADHHASGPHPEHPRARRRSDAGRFPGGPLLGAASLLRTAGQPRAADPGL